MDNMDAPTINRVKVSWRYEGETDYFNSQTYPDMYEAIKGMLKEVFPTMDFSNGCVIIPNKSSQDERPTYFEFVSGYDKIGIR